MESIFHFYKKGMALISIGFYYLYWKSGRLGEWFEERRRRGRERIFCSHPPHVGVKSWTKGKNSGKRPPRTQYWQIQKGENFFFRLAQNNECARRTRNREINHCALINAKIFWRKCGIPKIICNWLFFWVKILKITAASHTWFKIHENYWWTGLYFRHYYVFWVFSLHLKHSFSLILFKTQKS